MNQYSYGAFIMLAVVPSGTAGAAIHFDGTSSEDWTVTQDVPSSAVAQRQVHSQVIRGNTTFRVELGVSETPLELVPRLVPWYTPDDAGAIPESVFVYPDTRVGEDRVMSVWQALQDNLDARWDLHTTRHGFLGSMVLTSVDKVVDSPRRMSKFRLAFQRFEVADVASIKVQRQVRAQKGAAGQDKPGIEFIDGDYIMNLTGPYVPPEADVGHKTILKSRLDTVGGALKGTDKAWGVH